jgi:hypothetical protein
MSSIATAGEIDHWIFTANSSNSYYVIETYGNTDMFMYSYIQNELKTNNNGGEKLNANIGFLNSESGTQYDFEVKAYSQYSTGNYYIQIRLQEASIFTYDYGLGDIDTTPDSTIPANELSDMGYHIYNYQNYSETLLLSDDNTGLGRLNKEIVLFSGHGGKGLVVTSDFSNNESYLYSNELPYMGNTKVVVWASCESSTGNAQLNSMAEQSILNGARSSIGWPETTTVLSSRTFTNNFYKRITDGYNVSDSASYAASKIIWPWDNVKDYEIFGDNEAYINYELNDKQNTVSYVPIYSYYYQSLLPYESFCTSIVNNALPSNDVFIYQKEDLEFMYHGQKVERNHLVFNGILTNIYYDTINDGNTIINSSKEKMTEEDIIFLEYIKNNNYEFSQNEIMKKITQETVIGVEQHFVYIKHDGKVFPAIILYVDLNFEGFNFSVQEVFCYNMLTKEEIKYEEFSFEN